MEEGQRSLTEELLDHIEFVPDIAVLLKQMKDNRIKMAVVTSDSVSNAELILECFGIGQYFSVIIGRESIGASKISGISVLKARK